MLAQLITDALQYRSKLGYHELDISVWICLEILKVFNLAEHLLEHRLDFSWAFRLRANLALKNLVKEVQEVLLEHSKVLLHAITVKTWALQLVVV